MYKLHVEKHGTIDINRHIAHVDPLNGGSFEILSGKLALVDVLMIEV